jgi:hypothetical protein
VYFCPANYARTNPNPSDAFQFAPSALAELPAKSHDIAYSTADRDDFYIFNATK